MKQQMSFFWDDYDQDRRFLGAAAIIGLQAAYGQTVAFAYALNEWDSISEQQREDILETFRFMYSTGDFVFVSKRLILCPTYLNN